jgi:AcrR family transcriptional regulator
VPQSQSSGRRAAAAGDAAPRLSGRRAEAARNDELVIAAARNVLSCDPDAPMSAIADAAGVGMGTLYRRYPSKEALVLRLCLDAMAELRDIGLAHAEGDPWEAFAGFMTECAGAGAGSLLRLAGTFAPPQELFDAAEAMRAAADAVITRAQAAGVVRDDISVGDLNLLFAQLRAVPEPVRPRYLALMLQSLRGPAREPLPGPAPTWGDVRSRWTTASPASRPARR